MLLVATYFSLSFSCYLLQFVLVYHPLRCYPLFLCISANFTGRYKLSLSVVSLFPVSVQLLGLC